MGAVIAGLAALFFALAVLAVAGGVVVAIAMIAADELL